MTPLELITKIAARVPQPRAHRHRYYAVLAPNVPLRSVVAALAPAAVPPAPTSVATRAAPRDHAVSRYLWAMLLARIYQVFPLLCPFCYSQMRIIAFINDAGTVGEVLKHSGESPQPPRIAPAYGSALWEMATGGGTGAQRPTMGSSRSSQDRSRSSIGVSLGDA